MSPLEQIAVSLATALIGGGGAAAILRAVTQRAERRDRIEQERIASLERVQTKAIDAEVQETSVAQQALTIATDLADRLEAQDRKFDVAVHDLKRECAEQRESDAQECARRIARAVEGVERRFSGQIDELQKRAQRREVALEERVVKRISQQSVPAQPDEEDPERDTDPPLPPRPRIGERRPQPAPPEHVRPPRKPR
jgi:hypothetical protein